MVCKASARSPLGTDSITGLCYLHKCDSLDDDLLIHTDGV